MSARAPEAIIKGFERLASRMVGEEMSGIVGDENHSFGYHLSRRDLSGSDYSVILPLDKLGPSDAASALDIKLPPQLMITATNRLHTAALDHDTRLRGLREFCGTMNDKDTYPWDLSDNSSEGINTWDDSHLWHIHLSGYRAYADNDQVWADIADVVAGVGKPTPHPQPRGPYLHRKWPSFMPAGHYFGLITGPNQSHGGYYPRERLAVGAIQHRLRRLGYYEVGDKDNIFGPKTRQGVAAWQRHVAPQTTTLFGQIWPDDWHRLFTF